MGAPADLSAVIEAVRVALVGDGAILNSPATEDAIRETEQRLSIQLPDALRQLYRTFDGATNETTRSCWQFWPLRELRIEHHRLEEGETPVGEPIPQLYFCDALIECPIYSVCVDPLRAGNTEVYCLADGEHCYRSCASIERFLELFAARADEILIFDE